jgi:hypothetical protein
VVQLWPPEGTYCRSSSQIGQCSGVLSLFGNDVPQVVQMKFAMFATDNVRSCDAHSVGGEAASGLLRVIGGKRGVFAIRGFQISQNDLICIYSLGCNDFNFDACVSIHSFRATA